MISPRMLKLTPLILWTALSEAIIASVLVPLMTDTMRDKAWSPTEKNHYCLLSLIGQGVGEIVGAFIYGFVQDNSSDRTTLLVCLGLSSAAAGVQFAYVAHFDFTLWFGVLMCFCWGVQDGASNCLTSCILGFQFDSKTMPFSVFKTV